MEQMRDKSELLSMYFINTSQKINKKALLYPKTKKGFYT